MTIDNQGADDFLTGDLDDGFVESPNVLDDLRAELAQEIRRDNISIEVLERPNIRVEYDPNFGQPDIRKWRKQSGENSRKGFDSVAFACRVVGNTCEGIYINGKLATNEEGTALNFASPELLDMLDEDRPIPEGIQKFFGLDPHLEATALKIIEHAGFSDDVDVQEDPTKG